MQYQDYHSKIQFASGGFLEDCDINKYIRYVYVFFHNIYTLSGRPELALMMISEIKKIKKDCLKLNAFFTLALAKT